MEDVLQVCSGTTESGQTCNYVVLEMLSTALLLSFIFLGSSYWADLGHMSFTRSRSYFLWYLLCCVNPLGLLNLLLGYRFLKLPHVIFCCFYFGKREDYYYTPCLYILTSCCLSSCCQLFVTMLWCFPWWCAWYAPCEFTRTLLMQPSSSVDPI